MLSNKERDPFFHGLCEALKTHSFDRQYSEESDITEHVVEIVRDYATANGYGHEIGVFKERGLIKKISAFGREYAPDVTVEADRQPFIAIEVKLHTSTESCSP